MRAFLRSFGYAIQGINVAIKEERNMRFHLCAAVYVVLFSFFYPFGVAEYALLALLLGAVIGMEMINSAIERAVGAPVPGIPSKAAGQAKDMAAGAVLVLALAAVVCGVLLFWNIDVFLSIFAFFIGKPWFFLLLLISFVGSYWFVFHFGEKNSNSE